MSGIGERIKRRRLEENMTQDELAKKLDYKSRASINKIELGFTDITQSKIAAFAKALDTTPAYLMGWENESGTADLVLAALDLKRDTNMSDEEALVEAERLILSYAREKPATISDDGLSAVRRDLVNRMCKLPPKKVEMLRTLLQLLEEEEKE